MSRSGLWFEKLTEKVKTKIEKIGTNVMLPETQNIQTKKNRGGVNSEQRNIKAKETIEVVEEENSNKSTLSNDMLHMLMSEVRLQNTEMRLSLMKIHEKLDKHDDASNANKTTDVDAQIKKTMNK